MYAQANKNFTTPIEALMDLDAEEQGGGQGGYLMQGMQGMQGIGNFQSNEPTAGIPEKYQKFIRSSMGTPIPQSGMGQQQPPPDNSGPAYFPPPQQQAPVRLDDDSPTCLTVHAHVQSCPICSRFFKNDNTVYIIAIVILAIICILLLKRVLNL